MTHSVQLTLKLAGKYLNGVYWDAWLPLMLVLPVACVSMESFIWQWSVYYWYILLHIVRVNQCGQVAIENWSDVFSLTSHITNTPQLIRCQSKARCLNIPRYRSVWFGKICQVCLICSFLFALGDCLCFTAAFLTSWKTRLLSWLLISFSSFRMPTIYCF